MGKFQGTYAIVLLIGFVIGLPAGSAASGVKLKLESSSMSMFAPAYFAITGTLTGGSDTDPDLQCLTQEWVYQKTYQTITNHEENKSIRSSPCDDQTQPSEIVRVFKNEFTFIPVGRYTIRLLLKNQKGKVVTSGSITVKVLQPANPLYQTEEENKKHKY